MIPPFVPVARRSPLATRRSVYRTTAYLDYSEKDNEWIANQRATNLEKTGRGTPTKFSVQLHFMLESLQESGHTDIVCWQPHGRAFKISDKKRFEAEILPMFFIYQKEFSSFQRQLNIYGLLRLTSPGPDQFAYCEFSYGVLYFLRAICSHACHRVISDHPLLLRGRPELSYLLPRNRIAKRNIRRAFDVGTEPNFYDMAPVTARPSPSHYAERKSSVKADNVAQRPLGELIPALDHSAFMRTSETVQLEKKFNVVPSLTIDSNNAAITGTMQQTCDGASPSQRQGDAYNSSFSRDTTEEGFNTAPTYIYDGAFDLCSNSPTRTNNIKSSSIQRASENVLLRTDETVGALVAGMSKTVNIMVPMARNVDIWRPLLLRTSNEASDHDYLVHNNLCANSSTIGGIYPYGLSLSRTNSIVAGSAQSASKYTPQILSRGSNHAFQRQGGAFETFASGNATSGFNTATTLSSGGFNPHGLSVYRTNRTNPGTLRRPSDDASLTQGGIPEAFSIGNSSMDGVNTAPTPSSVRFNSYSSTPLKTNSSATGMMQRARDHASQRQDRFFEPAVTGDSNTEDFSIASTMSHGTSYPNPSLSRTELADAGTEQRAGNHASEIIDDAGEASSTRNMSTEEGLNWAPTLIQVALDLYSSSLSRSNNAIAITSSLGNTMQRVNDHSFQSNDDTVENLFNMLFPDQVDSTISPSTPLNDALESSCADITNWLKDTDL